jgi:hypothetical protein
MMNILRKKSLQVSAAVFTGLVGGVESAHAGGNDFSTITENITDSIASLPGLLTGVSYMMGILLGVLGILKIKDHVESPGNTKLQEGAIRLAAGGGLFALPIVYEAMQNTIGSDGSGPATVTLDGVTNWSTVN